MRLSADLRLIKDQLSTFGCASPSWSAATPHPQANAHPSAISRPFRESQERRFNVVFFGIKEQSPGTPRNERIAEDMESVTNILTVASSSIPAHAVRECMRLGKFTNDRCRPLLVKLNRSCDVSSILAHSRQIYVVHKISVRPDLPFEERRSRAILWRERNNLIKDGTDRSLIRIKGNSLYIDGQLSGSVVGSGYVPSDLPPLPILIL